MIRFRSFRNDDPPAIAEIWQSQSPLHARMQPMTAALLDDLVFSRPYFEREGMIVAVEDEGRPVGFAHAGFGPNAERSGLSYEEGTTSMLLVAPHEERDAIARDLLAESERYLCGRGATMLFGGATGLLAPFYFGLYGGSRLPGVLHSDAETVEVFQNSGYTEAAYSNVLYRELAGFRLPVDRNLIQIRRKFRLQQAPEPMPQNWWEASMFSHVEPLRFVLVPTSGGEPVAVADFWDIEPLASSWGVHAMGLIDLDAQDDNPDLATFILGESLRELQSFGTTLVEIQMTTDHRFLADVCQRMGFVQRDCGLLFRKQAAE